MDFANVLSEQQDLMLRTLIGQMKEVYPGPMVHIEGLLDRVTPRLWAGSQFGLTAQEFEQAVAKGALEQYSQFDVKAISDSEMLLAYILVTYEMLSKLRFSQHSFPGDKVAHEIAEELKEIAPSYSTWLIAASERWLDLAEERAKRRVLLLEMAKRPIREA